MNRISTNVQKLKSWERVGKTPSPKIKLILLLFLLQALLVISADAQNRTISGTVTSAEDKGSLPGVSVIVKGTTNGTTTGADGDFTISVPQENATLVFTFVGFTTKEVPVSNQTRINVVLAPDAKALDEVVVVGFGEQKKASVVSSITSVNVKELKTPSSNLTNAIAGKVPGIISFQQSGEPGLGTDNSTFYIRGLSSFGTGKRDPLILIDGIESSPVDMARLQPDDISDFSVLKDAAASAIYGARGANGVLLINTKSGKEGTTKFSFRAENRVSTNTKNFKFADNITYMQLANEAALTRTPNGVQPYTQNKINHTIAGDDPYLYPNNNWIDQLIKDYTINQGYNLNISGGTAKARYYIAGTFNRDNGNLKVDPINDFNSNIKLNNYSIRTNIDLNLTKSTVFTVRMYGQFDDYTGPIGTNGRSGGRTAFDNALRANPVMFPATYPSSKLPYIEHPLFGSSQALNSAQAQTSVLYLNPYAEMVKGYQVTRAANLNPQIEFKQDLASITEGLSARAMGYIKRVSRFSLNRSYNPFFYRSTINPEDGSYDISVMNDGSSSSVPGVTVGTEYLNYSEGEKVVESQFWGQAAIDYNRVFGKHAVGGLLVSYMSDYQTGNPGDLILSLPNRNQGISGRFSYGFDDKYLAELNFGYNGSERFAREKRYGFFPSVGVAYRLSNEPFFQPFVGTVNNLKLRATYGVVGNDQIGLREDRFLYMSRILLNDSGYGASFGRNDGTAPYYQPGISIQRYANPNIGWEVSRQVNLGLDLGLYNNSVELIVDAYKARRTRILEINDLIENANGLMAYPYINSGVTENQGVDLSLNIRKTFTPRFNADFRGTMTYATNKIVNRVELVYPNSLSHLSRKGQSISQGYGFIAERLFVDDEEVANSPVQFGDPGLLAGDIKYRDVNRDGVINNLDVVPLGYPQQPEIIYGLGTTMRYGKFDANIFFQGSARSTFFIDPAAIQPFYQQGGLQNGLLQVIAEDHWSEEDPDSYAVWPRLSTWRVGPNNVRSTWWMRNGSFLRLKNVDLGYNLTNVKRLGVSSARLYLSATNLLVISKFKMWDVEMGGNGLNYPVQSVYNAGVSVNF